MDAVSFFPQREQVRSSDPCAVQVGDFVVFQPLQLCPAALQSMANGPVSAMAAGIMPSSSAAARTRLINTGMALRFICLPPFRLRGTCPLPAVRRKLPRRYSFFRLSEFYFPYYYTIFPEKSTQIRKKAKN
jgi:hypothetical protein